METETKPNFFTPRTRLALASILLAGVLLLLFLPSNAGAYRALPTQTSLVLECTGLLRAKLLADKTADPRWRPVLHSPLFQTCFEDTDAAAKLFMPAPDVFRAFAKKRALAALSLHPADSLHALFALELEADFDLKNFLKTSKQATKYFPHQFHGNDIFNVHLSKTERLEVAVSGKLLLFSRRATLVEDALAQLENTRNWWTDRPCLDELPDAPLRISLRPAALAEQWRSMMSPRWRSLPDLLARNVEWLGFSWDGKDLTAMTETTGTLGGIALWGARPGNKIFDVLPDNTAFLARAGLGNIPEFFRQIGDGRSSDFEQYVLPWVGREAALAVTEPLSAELVGDRLLLLAVRDSALASSRLRAYGKDRGVLGGASGQYQMFEVLGFRDASLLQPILGDDEAFRNPVCALAGGYAIFATDRSSLEIFLDKYLVSQTLAANTDLLQLQHRHSHKGCAYVLLNTAYLPSLLQNIFASPGPISASFGGDKVGAAFVSVGFDRKAGDIALASQALSQPLSETDILWKALLTSPVATQPYLVEQPDGKTVVLVQDSKNKLYCLDAQNGGLLWDEPLSEHILSDIQGIDFYGNGTKCYTFSTKAQIFALDEKGVAVHGFPLKLPAPASNGATVVDFDKNTKFNFFVACDNGKIYGFGHLGKPLDGWNGIPSNGSVRPPILHFQHKGKDYLAVLTDDGLLSVYGRDGALRFAPVQLAGIQEGSEGIVNHFSPLAADLGSTTPRIYTSNTGGQVLACDLQGKVSVIQVGSLGSLAAFGQLAGDARFEWAVLDGKTLTVGDWANGGSTFFKTQFREKQHHVFFTKNNRIGTVDLRGKRVWLLDNKGKAVAGFPLGGSTVFEFAKQNGVDMLVTGNWNGVWAYRVRG